MDARSAARPVSARGPSPQALAWLAQAVLAAVRRASLELRLVTREEVLAMTHAAIQDSLACGAATACAGEGADLGADVAPDVAPDFGSGAGTAIGADVRGAAGADAGAQPQLPGPAPEELQALDSQELAALLDGILASQPGLACLDSHSGQTLYHAPDLLSCTYARILDRKGSPLLLMAGEIRANSRDYPRPVPVELFEAPPFDLTPEEIGQTLRALAADPEHQDISFVTTPTGAVHLFSTRHLERGYAAFLAQRAESLAMNP